VIYNSRAPYHLAFDVEGGRGGKAMAFSTPYAERNRAAHDAPPAHPSHAQGLQPWSAPLDSSEFGCGASPGLQFSHAETWWKPTSPASAVQPCANGAPHQPHQPLGRHGMACRLSRLTLSLLFMLHGFGKGLALDVGKLYGRRSGMDDLGMRTWHLVGVEFLGVVVWN
jgi:hypothetical protein